jgi:hypothetical protein
LYFFLDPQPRVTWSDKLALMPARFRKLVSPISSLELFNEISSHPAIFFSHIKPINSIFHRN